MDGRVGHDYPHFFMRAFAITASDQLRVAGIIPGASGVRMISPFNHPHVMQNGILRRRIMVVPRDTNDPGMRFQLPGVAVLFLVYRIVSSRPSRRTSMTALVGVAAILAALFLEVR
jgi:hypothetical protein